MTPDVSWPMAFKGGFVRGPQEVRAYWSEQWREIDPHVEPVACHPQGARQVLADEPMGHWFTIATGLIRAVAVAPLP